ncbi:hypothetical protein KRX57_07850 [Weeksellaceae bacterium TAE3-ERU29]|nr:hypothetical protein [Weeksellaceae bacterium TAE3-ERU29]
MKVFFNFGSEKLNEEDALMGSVWQVLDLFYELPNDNQSFVGLKDNTNFILEIRRINLYQWEWSTFNTINSEYKVGYFSFTKSEQLIRSLFNNLKINDIPNLKIEKK